MFSGICMFVHQMKNMQFKLKIPIVFVALLAWVVIVSSCANIGMPTGGPRDTIPPELVATSPEYGALNYKGKDVRLTFDEYIMPDKVSEELVISPPLAKRPVIKTKSKTLIVQFNETLRDSATYSLDFKNSVVDNNEKNPIPNLRFLFSTGPVLDTLRVAGKVVDAFNLEPQENILVLLHRNLTDTAIQKVLPDYIAKTNEEGMFLMDNVAPGTYQLFAVNDQNGDYLYNVGAEEIAFVDTLVVPSVEFHQEVDTTLTGVDSMLVKGHTHFLPEPFYMHYFMEDVFEQYLESVERESRYKCRFLFNESVSDTFGVEVVGLQAPQDWMLLECNPTMDTLVLWITDTTLAKNDSLYFELSYTRLDSAGERVVQCDTVLMKYSDPVREEKKKRKKEEEPEAPAPIPQFVWKSSIPSTMELNGRIRLTAPEPVASFDSTMMRLYLAEDTLKRPLPILFRKDTAAYRTYFISYDWEPEQEYIFEVDSAACVNIYGITSAALSKKFKVREKDYYGSLSFDFSGVECPMIVQLLKNSDKEEVLREKHFDKNGRVEFSLLAPGKYRVKVIYDRNNNGKWDGGSLKDKRQPEPVAYVNEVIKLRSNWSQEHRWDVYYNPAFVKNIVDKEELEKKRKAAAEKALREKREQEKSSPFRSGTKDGGSMR